VADNYGNHLMLLYNKALVQGAPQNTDAWIRQLKSLTDAASGQYGLVFPLAESYWLMPWLAGFGGWPLNAADKPALDTVEMTNALQFLYDLQTVHHVVSQKTDYDAAFDLFSQGKAAYIIDGMWNLDRYTGLGIDVGVAPLPVVSATGLKPAPMATGRYWLISDEAEGAALDAAARFVEFMTSADAQGQWLAKMKRLPSAKEAAQSALIADDPILAGAMTQLRVARGVPPALDMACVWSGIDAHLSEVMAGARTPENGAAAMQADAEACIEETGGGEPTPTPEN
jgi:arabinogalactan oligomer/maltooligosaccharide transport system substrate-binding protein